MKNSASLRYFADLPFNRELTQYEQMGHNLKTFENLTDGVYTEVRKIRAQLFSFKYNAIINEVSHIKDSKLRRDKIDAFIKTNPPLLNTDKVLFNEYVELVRSRFLDRKIVFAEEILIHADTLIAGLKKKYNLKDGEE